MIPGDHLGSFLSDHDAGGVGISTDHVGHNARICYAQISDTDNPELRIYNTADPARAAEVVNGEREMQRKVLQERVARSRALAVPMFGSEFRGRQPRAE